MKLLSILLLLMFLVGCDFGVSATRPEGWAETRERLFVQCMELSVNPDGDAINACTNSSYYMTNAFFK